MMYHLNLLELAREITLLIYHTWLVKPNYKLSVLGMVTHNFYSRRTAMITIKSFDMSKPQFNIHKSRLPSQQKARRIKSKLNWDIAISKV